MRFVAAILLLLILAGCTPIPPPPVPQLEIIEQDQSWVQVRVTGIDSIGYQILWGDVDTSYGITDVSTSDELYAHFYQPVEGGRSGEEIPTEYEIVLTNKEGYVVAQKSILVVSAACHLKLVSLEDRKVIVEYWGRFVLDYSICWGDHFADHVTVSPRIAREIATHTYAAPGTYWLGIQEIAAPSRNFFKITVE